MDEIQRAARERLAEVRELVDGTSAYDKAVRDLMNRAQHYPDLRALVARVRNALKHKVTP